MKLVVLSGAGISAESGIKTFRDTDGLWENHKIEDIASVEGFFNNPQKVLDFYNLRRRQLKEVKPNSAHLALAELENDFDVHIITQNVDNLHERAGSKNVLHLHGELNKAKSINHENEILYWENDLNLGDLHKDGSQLRPHIVWFGEDVPEMENAIRIAANADILLIIGTSLQVYPAASLIHYAPNYCEVFMINPEIEKENLYVEEKNCIRTTATEGMKQLKELLTEFA